MDAALACPGGGIGFVPATADGSPRYPATCPHCGTVLLALADHLWLTLDDLLATPYLISGRTDVLLAGPVVVDVVLPRTDLTGSDCGATGVRPRPAAAACGAAGGGRPARFGHTVRQRGRRRQGRRGAGLRPGDGGRRPRAQARV
jgi:hypothetical protein